MLNHAEARHLSGAGCDMNSTVNHAHCGLPCSLHHRKPICVIFEQYIHDTFLLYVALDCTMLLVCYIKPK